MNVMSEQQIEKIINLMQTDDSTDAPQSAVRWAKNLFAARAVASRKSFAQKIFAVLQMDLSPNKAVFGERSASVSKARQMLFQAGENALDIRIGETTDGFDLHGQILGENFANAVIKIGEFETTANETSEFKLTNVPKGKYDVHLRSGEKEIVIENLEIS